MLKLENRVALVTAGGSGMGRAACETFAAEGAHVLIVDIDGSAAEAAAAEIIEAGGSAKAFAVDVSDIDALRELFDKVERDHGVLHVLYNHAGTPGPIGLGAPEDEFDRFIAVNTKGLYYATSFAVPLLKKASPHASIIFTSSSRAVIASPKRPMYSYSKGGVVSFAKAVAKLLAADGIRANSILPGHTRTAMTSEFFKGTTEEVDKMISSVVAGIPLGREGTPADIAPVALFLASDDSLYVTGVAIPVDGGYLA